MGLQIVRRTEDFTVRFPKHKQCFREGSHTEAEEAEQWVVLLEIVVDYLASRCRAGISPEVVDILDTGIGFTVQEAGVSGDDSKVLVEILKEAKGKCKTLAGRRILSKILSLQQDIEGHLSESLKSSFWYGEDPIERLVKETIEAGARKPESVWHASAGFYDVAYDLVYGNRKLGRRKGAEAQLIFMTEGFTLRFPEDCPAYKSEDDDQKCREFKGLVEACVKNVELGYDVPVVELFSTGIGFTFAPKGEREEVTLRDILAEVRAEGGDPCGLDILESVYRGLGCDHEPDISHILIHSPERGRRTCRSGLSGDPIGSEYNSAAYSAMQSFFGDGMDEVQYCLSFPIRDGMELRCIWDQTDEICLVAVQNNGLALQYVREQTFDICLAAVEQNSEAVNLIRDPEMKKQVEDALSKGDKTTTEKRGFWSVQIVRRTKEFTGQLIRKEIRNDRVETSNGVWFDFWERLKGMVYALKAGDDPGILEVCDTGVGFTVRVLEGTTADAVDSMLGILQEAQGKCTDEYGKVYLGKVLEQGDRLMENWSRFENLTYEEFQQMRQAVPEDSEDVNVLDEPIREPVREAKGLTGEETNSVASTDAELSNLIKQMVVGNKAE